MQWGEYKNEGGIAHSDANVSVGSELIRDIFEAESELKLLN